MIRQDHKRGLSLVELLVAIGLLAMVILMAGAVFRIAAQTTRLSRANAEILQKLRVVTQQLDADLRGLQKDAEVFVGYVVAEDPNSVSGLQRFDRFMFYTTGTFRAPRPGGRPGAIYGQVARVGYFISGASSYGVLVRFQHVLTGDPTLPQPVDPNSTDPGLWRHWAIGRLAQYDRTSMQQWSQMPLAAKRAALVGLMGVDIEQGLVQDELGPSVEPADPCSAHLVLCEGVVRFEIQGWSDVLRRWVPQVDPDQDGSLVDSDLPVSGGRIQAGKAAFVLASPAMPARLSFGPGVARLAGDGRFRDFYSVPGLGRVLKFTITIRDSKGIIKGGKTFTYLVELDR